MKRLTRLLILISIVLILITAISAVSASTNYKNNSNWIVTGNNSSNVDCFYLMGTQHSNYKYIIPINNKTRINGAKKVEQATLPFNNQTKIYAPAYKQVSITGFVKRNIINEKAHEKSYEDVKNAFYYYYFNINKGKKPFFIAGHSQGSYHISKLLKDIEKDKRINKDLIISIYATGWNFSPKYFKNTTIQLSKSPNDLGKLITYGSIYKVKQIKTNPYAGGVQINPLTWKSTSKKINNTYNSTLYYRGEFINIGKIFKTAQIVKGNLLVGGLNTKVLKKYGQNSSSIKMNLHTLEYAIFSNTLSENINNRIRNYFLRYLWYKS
ncbi:MAG: DUF3089 domain-containing protein [Methanobacteriaceae archaeon]